MAKGRKDNTKTTELDESFSVKLHSSTTAPYRGEDQCCKCGARSKLAKIDRGILCGVCGSAVTWT